MRSLMLTLGCVAVALMTALPAQAQGPAGEFTHCIGRLRSELKRHPEIRDETFETYASSAQDLRPLIDKATSTQPEFTQSVWDYLARRVDAQRVVEGRDLLERMAGALVVMQQRHAVDGATVVAVYGVETDYGRLRDKYPVVDATLGRACLNLASEERKSQFFAALWLLQQGYVKPDEFRGSWAGAFGLTQFMPATFVRYMDAADGSGAPDIMHSTLDALATTARYLRAQGWSDGLPWGIEVQVPRELALRANALEGDHACLATAEQGGGSAGKCRRIDEWAAAGVKNAAGKALRTRDPTWPGLMGSTPAALLMPAGAAGPAWLVTSNYQAIWRYNRADSYALAIGLLSDALRGGPGQRAAWPTDDPGLSRAQFRELQALLLRQGHCAMVVDGAQGAITDAAIRQEESRRGWPETGHPGMRLLAALRRDAHQAAARPCEKTQ